MQLANNIRRDFIYQNNHTILDSRRINNFNKNHTQKQINQINVNAQNKENLSNQSNPISIKNIGRFLKSHQKIMEKVKNKNKIIENIKNNDIFHNIHDRKFYQNFNGYNNINALDHINKDETYITFKKYENNFVRNAKLENHHKYHEIICTTKNQNLQKNVFKNIENNYHQNMIVKNNKDNNYFIKTLRNYGEDNNSRKTTCTIKSSNEKNNRVNKNQNNNTNYILEHQNIKTKNIVNFKAKNKYISNNKKDETNVREKNFYMKYPLDNNSKTNGILNNTNVNYKKTNSVDEKNIQKYVKNTKQNDLNKIIPNAFDSLQNIYKKKLNNNSILGKKKENKNIRKFKTLKIINFSIRLEKTKKKGK